MAYHTPSALAQNFGKLASQAYGVATSQLINPGRFKMVRPEGLTYECFNPRGQPTVWSIIRQFEMARVMGFWGTGSQLADLGQLENMVYVASLKLTCEPDLYNSDVKKQPAETNTELVYVGNTSFKIRSNLFLSQMSKKVAEQDISLVHVDTETRRPTTPPKWWKEKYAPYSLPNEGPIKSEYLDFSQQTEDIQEDEFIVRSSDLDPYCHVNNISFIRLCYEAYITSHVRHFGYTGGGDPFRNVKELSCAFRGEAGLGDLLRVALVKDPSDKDMCHFQINKGSQMVFQCYLKFYPQILSN